MRGMERSSLRSNLLSVGDGDAWPAHSCSNFNIPARTLKAAEPRRLMQDSLRSREFSQLSGESASFFKNFSALYINSFIKCLLAWTGLWPDLDRTYSIVFSKNFLALVNLPCLKRV